MSDLTPHQPRHVQVHAEPEHCRYCGAKLLPQVYFCLACATPYKSVESVLPAVRPAMPTMAELIDKKAPQVRSMFWTYFTACVSMALLSGLLFGQSRRLVGLLLQSIVLTAITLIYAIRYWPSLAVQFRRLGFLQWQPYAGLAALGPLLLANYAWHSILPHEFSQSVDALKSLGQGGAILVIAILPAIIEETSFRGLIQHWMTTAVGDWKALVLASALFTALHFSLFSFPYIFAVGMLLGWLKWRTGSLYPGMLVHFLHNLLVIELF